MTVRILASAAKRAPTQTVLVLFVIIGGVLLFFQRDEAKTFVLEANVDAELHCLVQNSMMR